MIESKEDLKRYLEMDRFAYHTDRKHPRFFGDDIWKFLIALRKQEYYTNVKSVFFSIIMKRFYSKRHSHLGNKLGYDIPVNTCGGGVKLFHRGNIVIHPGARIGEWCSILQGVTIGQGFEPDDVPVIGNNVIILAGAKIFGKIVIGNDVMIGANAVVNKSFPEGHCRIAGVPAKVISNEGNVWVNGRNAIEEKHLVDARKA